MADQTAKNWAIIWTEGESQSVRRFVKISLRTQWTFLKGITGSYELVQE